MHERVQRLPTWCMMSPTSSGIACCSRASWKSTAYSGIRITVASRCHWTTAAISLLSLASRTPGPLPRGSPQRSCLACSASPTPRYESGSPPSTVVRWSASFLTFRPRSSLRRTPSDGCISSGRRPRRSASTSQASKSAGPTSRPSRSFSLRTTWFDSCSRTRSEHGGPHVTPNLLCLTAGSISAAMRMALLPPVRSVIGPIVLPT